MAGVDTNLEVRSFKNEFGIYETGAEEPLVVFHDRKNAELVLSEMLVEPATLLTCKLVNRLSNSIYDAAEDIRRR